MYIYIFIYMYIYIYESLELRVFSAFVLFYSCWNGCNMFQTIFWGNSKILKTKQCFLRVNSAGKFRIVEVCRGVLLLFFS